MDFSIIFHCTHDKNVFVAFPLPYICKPYIITVMGPLLETAFILNWYESALLEIVVMRHICV